MGEDGVVWINQPVISGKVSMDRNQNGNQDTVFYGTPKYQLTQSHPNSDEKRNNIQMYQSAQCLEYIHSKQRGSGRLQTSLQKAITLFQCQAAVPLWSSPAWWEPRQGFQLLRNGCLISNGTALFRKHAWFGHCLILIHHCQNCQKSEQDTIGLPNPNPTHFVAGLVGWKEKEIRWLPKPLQLPRSL